MINNNYNSYIKYSITLSVFVLSIVLPGVFFTGSTQAATECIGQWPSSQMSVTVRYDNSSGPVIGTYTNPADSDGYSIRNFTINNVQTGRRLHFSGTATAPDQNAPSSVNYPYNQNQSFSEGFITWTRNWTSSREIDSNTSFHWDIIGNCNGSPPFNWDGGYAEINIAINIATAPPPPPPPSCGNGSIDAGEQCDGGNLNGQTCSSLGYASQTGTGLSCNSQCQFNTSQCGRNKCGGGGSGNCGFVAGDIGANQCTAPNDAVCTNALVCNPGSQSIGVGGSANLNASGGSGGYSWSAPGGSPTSGTGSTFVTGYSTTGTKTITLTSGAQNTTCTVNVSTTGGCSGNCADFLSQNVPGVMESGKTYQANISYQNTGTTTWDYNAGFYWLGSQNPQLNTTWNEVQTQNVNDPDDNGIVYLPPNPFVVSPGSSHNFVFNVTAPTVSAATNYNFQWRVRRHAFPSEWFGEYTDNRVIQVVPPWSCTAIANPDSGNPPLSGVDVNVTGVGNNASYNYVDCTSDGTFDVLGNGITYQTSNAVPPNYTIDSNCSYPDAGNYTMTVRRQELGGLSRITSCTAPVQVGATPPTFGSVTINSPTVVPNNSNPYVITISGNEVTGGANITQQYTMINHGGGPPNEGQYRGELVWTLNNLFPAEKDLVQCTEGGSITPTSGWAVINTNAGANLYGSQYMNLNSCTTSVSGNTRTTTFTVRFAPVFTTPTTNNDISGFLVGGSGSSGWVNFNINFSLLFPPPSVTNSTVRVFNSRYCGSGVHATVEGTYSDPGGLSGDAFEILIDDDLVSNPNTSLASMNPEWESGTVSAAIPNGSTFSRDTSSPCNTSNPDARPQLSCQMKFNNPAGSGVYTAWARARNNTGTWSPWVRMSLYSNNGGPLSPQTSWLTPVHAFPGTSFTYAPPSPSADMPVAFTDTTSFAAGSVNRTWNWNFGGGTPGTSALQNPINTYSSVGSYPLSLIAGDDVGSCPSVPQTIIIQNAIPQWREVAPR